MKPTPAWSATGVAVALMVVSMLLFPARPGAQNGASPAPTLEAGLGMRLVLVPPGEFVVAGPSESSTVLRLPGALYVGTEEVTRAQYEAFVEATGGQAVDKAPRLAGETLFPATPRHPAGFVSWQQARDFTRWLSRREERAYRIPTESEWEYLCRAGSTGRDWWEDQLGATGEVANVADVAFQRHFPQLARIATIDDGHAFTAPVGSYRANHFGIHDLIGNVWEWVDTTATRPERIAKGGSFASGPDRATCHGRLAVLPGERYAGTGFRVVLDPQARPPAAP